MQQSQYSNPQDLKSIIGSLQSVIQIKKPDFCIYFFGCKQERQYSLFQLQNGTYKEIPNTQFLKAKEQSNFLVRCCIANNCRPYTLVYDNTVFQNQNQFLLLEKDCSLTCLCFNRPVVKAYFVENG